MKRIEYEKIHDVIFFFFFFFSQRISLVQNFLILYSTPSREHPPRLGVTSAYTGVNSTCLPGKARKEQQEEEKEIYGSSVEPKATSRITCRLENEARRITARLIDPIV